MKRIAIVGAGGFGKEVACIIDRINKTEGVKWEFIGFFDDHVPAGERSVIGDLNELNSWSEPLDVVIAIGNSEAIMNVHQRINNPLIDFPNIIDPSTRFYDRNRFIMGRGNIFAIDCIVSCDVLIGDFNVFNGKVSIGHDAKIGSYNVLMPSVSISGNTVIGNDNFFGVGSIVLQKVKVGNRVRLGAASVLIKHSKDNNLYWGNPATILKL